MDEGEVKVDGDLTFADIIERLYKVMHSFQKIGQDTEITLDDKGTPIHCKCRHGIRLAPDPTEMYQDAHTIDGRSLMCIGKCRAKKKKTKYTLLGSLIRILFRKNNVWIFT